MAFLCNKKNYLQQLRQKKTLCSTHQQHKLPDIFMSLPAIKKVTFFVHFGMILSRSLKISHSRYPPAFSNSEDTFFLIYFSNKSMDPKCQIS